MLSCLSEDIRAFRLFYLSIALSLSILIGMGGVSPSTPTITRIGSADEIGTSVELSKATTIVTASIIITNLNIKFNKESIACPNLRLL